LADLGHDRLVVPLAGPDEGLDRLTVDAGIDGDRLAGLALQAAEKPTDDEGGVVTLLGPPEAGQVAFEESGESILTAPDGLGAQSRVGEDGLGVGMVQERHGGPSHRISYASIINPVKSMQ
jgi:hypothetical protein